MSVSLACTRPPLVTFRLSFSPVCRQRALGHRRVPCAGRAPALPAQRPAPGRDAVGQAGRPAPRRGRCPPHAAGPSVPLAGAGRARAPPLVAAHGRPHAPRRRPGLGAPLAAAVAAAPREARRPRRLGHQPSRRRLAGEFVQQMIRL